jgi:cell division protein FtsA
VLTAIPDNQCVLHALPASFWVDNQQFSGSPLQQPGNRLDVEAHIVTVPKALIDNLRTALTAIGVTVEGVVANSIVGALGLAHDAAGSNRLVIDIGAGTTDLVICQQERVRLSASLPIGGDYITSDIMQGLAISHSHAEDVKRYYCRLDKSLLGSDVTLNCDYEQQSLQVPYDFLHKIIESRVEEIISLGFEHVSKAMGKYDVSEIYLTGGCAVMPSIQQCAQHLFQLPARIGQIAQVPAEYKGPGNVVNFGLLLHGAQCMPAVKEQASFTWLQSLKNLANHFWPSR